MVTLKRKTESIRTFILENVGAHPRDIAGVTGQKFGLTRQAVHKHLQQLVAEKALIAEGNTRSKVYRLCPLARWQKRYRLSARLAEDVVWREDVAPTLGTLPDNVMKIWHFGFTEMFNNAIDHSEGTAITVLLERTAAETGMAIVDNGVGIFRKIQRRLGLLDERHAVLELAKGKLTTDPDRHTGEGIFFSSRAFDKFQILSGGICFSHRFEEEDDWILEATERGGTGVWMQLGNHTARNLKKVFDKFTSGDDFGFTKTIVPVRLAQYGGDLLVSRSQARRLLARVDRFRTVVLDFAGVKEIGQAFADEIFRVFARQNRKIELLDLNAGEAVAKMIRRARAVPQVNTKDG